MKDLLSVGVISAPRPYISNSLDSFFDEYTGLRPEVFAEPGVTGFRHIADCDVHHNERTLGCVKNWLNCVQWLHDNTDSSFVMVCEDDIQWMRGSGVNVMNLLRVLRSDIWVPIVQEKMPVDKIGFISPYCAKLNRPKDKGWHEGRYNKSGLCGALSIIMPRSSLEQVVLRKQELLQISNGVCLDHSIGAIFEGRINLTHLPTLVLHIGTESTYESNNKEHNRHDISRQPAL